MTPAIMPFAFGISSGLASGVRRRLSAAAFGPGVLLRPSSRRLRPCALRTLAAARRAGTRGRPSARPSVGSRPKSSRYAFSMRARIVRLRRRTRRASSSACCCMKSLFMKNSRCSGTLVDEPLLGATGSGSGSRTAAGTRRAGSGSPSPYTVRRVPTRVSASDGPPIFVVERAGDKQHRVADLLGGQAAPVRAPVQPVAGVLREARLRRRPRSAGRRRSA